MASHSSNAKVKFMQALDEIKTTNYALQFCSLLIEAQKMHEEYRDEGKKMCRSSEDHLKQSKKFFLDIKNIVNQEPVGIVKNIFMVLHAPEENLHAEKQQLLNFPSKSECEKSCEYLEQLIGTVESLVKLFSSTDLYFYYFGIKKKNHERNLVTLKRYMSAYGKHKAGFLFRAMFQIGLDAFDFSQEEKEKIKDLVIKAIPNIELIIQDLCFDHESRMGVLSLQKRSSLQFFRDLIADYSAENEIMREFIRSLDSLMKQLDEFSAWCELTESDDDMSDDDFSDGDFSDDDLPFLANPRNDISAKDETIYDDFFSVTLEDFNSAGACDVPKEHIWWQTYKEVHFKSL